MMVERAELVEKDRRYVWHPYTPMEEYVTTGEPLVIERAAGARLFDRDGRSYIDGNASWWTSLLGHNHPRLVAALSRQAARFCHVALAGMTHEPAVEFAEELIKVAPEGVTRVFFSDNGSTAVEAALKMSAQYWQQNGAPGKSVFLALEQAFHGETLGVTALGGVAAFRRPFASLTMPTIHVPSPAIDLDRAVHELGRKLREFEGKIAGFVVEPLVQGAGGMRIYDRSYLVEARRLTEEHGVHLIVDEVFTGYGRTGTMWALDQAGVRPDILCSAKGLSGGILPFSVTLASEEIFRGFFGGPERAFYYGHTYCGNPLGAAVAREVLEVYREEEVIAKSAAKAAKIRATFAELAKLPGVEDVRALGMIGALSLRSPKGDGYLARSGWRVFEKALQRGAVLRPLGNVVYIAPALNIADEDLSTLLEIVSASVAEVCGELH